MTTGPPFACVVPVLPVAAGPSVGAAPPASAQPAAPVAVALLHGRPLLAWAVARLRAAYDAPVLVTAPPAVRAAVHTALAADGRADVPVLPVAAGLGAALAEALRVAAPPPDGLLVVHDPRCPLTPLEALQSGVAAALQQPGAAVVAAHVVSDTVKEVVDALVRATVDRDRLRSVASPLVLPVALLHPLLADGRLQRCDDVADLVGLLHAVRAPLVWTSAPPLARRVDDVDAVALLECVTAPD